MDRAVNDVIEKLRKDLKEKIRRASATKSDELTAKLFQSRKLVNGVLEKLHSDLVATALSPRNPNEFTTDETADTTGDRDSDDSDAESSDDDEVKIKDEVLDDVDELGF